MLTRRDFLKTALAATAACTLLPIGRAGWAFAAGPGAAPRKRLVVIFLRGAVDGLSVVVPYAEPAYYELRPRIAIARPGQPGGALDLDGRFGLHPALAPLLPLWQAGSLAFVHASGSKNPTRSHFEAQDSMESAMPGTQRATTGWMNRLLATLPGPHAPNAAVSIGETIPRILAGKQAVANLELGKGAAQAQPLDRERVAAAFDRMYDQADPALRVAYQQGRAARTSLLADLMAEDAEQKAASAGAPLPNGFAYDATQLAHLIRRDAGIQLAFLALGGWDTHVDQGAANGQLAGRLKALGEGLHALATQLGPAFADTTVVVMSEFGRTLAENGDAGTDHGHGNAMWLLGGQVGGGKVYGRWPGLAREQRFEGRDLAVTTDFREVLMAVLRAPLGLSAAQAGQVLPGVASAGNGLEGLIARV